MAAIVRRLAHTWYSGPLEAETYLANHSDVVLLIVQSLHHTIKPRGNLQSRCQQTLPYKIARSYLYSCFVRLNLTYWIKLLYSISRLDRPAYDLTLRDSYKTQFSVHGWYMISSQTYLHRYQPRCRGVRPAMSVNYGILFGTRTGSPGDRYWV
jgi:hypothetical protein